MNETFVYLDHNAGSPLKAAARSAMLGALDAAGNASSVHAAGRRARAIIERARGEVARLAGAKPASVIFTSNGSEANALAIKGAVFGALAQEDRKTQNRITRLFVSAIEHDSVRANAAALAESVPGLRLREIPVTKDGVVDSAVLRLQLMEGKGRALISVMAANNETGAVQPMKDIIAAVRAEGGANALIHVDAVAVAGRLALAFDANGIDYLTLSAHKLGGPQGVGALIIKDGAPLAPLVAGGGQEMYRRGGTEAIAAIAGFGAAAAEAADFTAENVRLLRLRERFEAALKKLSPASLVFSTGVERLPNTSNFAIPGLAAETALIALDLDGVALSSGAACSSGKVTPSHVLSAMGVGEDLARCGLRLSLGHSNSENDIDAAVASLERLLERRATLAA